MRRTPLKTHPLQESIESFHRSPVYECRQQLRGEEGRLRKIGRNRLVFKETPLPAVAPLRNKENEQPGQNCSLAQREGKPSGGARPNAKNLSFGHTRVLNLEGRLSRMVASQKDLCEQNQSGKLKEALLKKQFFIRDRKMLPQRNCLSANLKKDTQEPPQGVREFRKALRRHRSREVKEEELRQMGPCQQAQRIAEEARPLTAPNASRHPVRSASLEDFLNEWKGGCLNREAF